MTKKEQLLQEADELLERVDQIHQQIGRVPISSGESYPPSGSSKKTFRTFGDFVQSVIRSSTPGAQVDTRLYALGEDRAASGLSEAIPSDGGYAVGVDFSNMLLASIFKTSTLAGRVRRIQISSNSNRIKINGIDESSRADGSRWGGIRGYYVNEADQISKSKPKFRQLELTLNKLAALVYLTEELLEDAAALEDVVVRAVSDEFAFSIDRDILRGDGAGKPLGILNSGALISISKETGQAASTLLWENIVKMFARSTNPTGSIWVAHQSIIPQLFSMNLAVGTGGVPVFMPANGVSGVPQQTLFGLPIFFVEQASVLGTKGDLLLIDPQAIILADKGGVRSASSIHLRFEYDERVLRFIYRYDAQPAYNKAVTPYSGTDTVSPYVSLADRL